jgi:hypothetical protein
MLFDHVNFNGEVFDTLVRQTPNLRLNQLLKCGAIVTKPEYASMLSDQKGGHFITTLIKERISGTPVNYDGKTNITATNRGNYAMGRIVVGRAGAWVEKDFVSDISGDDYSAAAGEVAEYFDDIDQNTLISTLKGVFNMTGGESANFVKAHTYNISANADGVFDATTLNNAMQQALGDNKGKFSMVIMHSVVATHLENLKLLEYMKYTDADGIERNLDLATLNGRLVLVDDTMPTAIAYKTTADTAVVSGKTYYTLSGGKYTAVAEPKTADIATYYEAYTTYTSYVLGNGAIEMTDCGVKTPSEMKRDALTNGGETTLVSRQRKTFAPFGISWKSPSIISPTDAQLENGSNWELANNNDSSVKKYYPAKAIGIAQIITRG